MLGDFTFVLEIELGDFTWEILVVGECWEILHLY